MSTRDAQIFGCTAAATAINVAPSASTSDPSAELQPSKTSGTPVEQQTNTATRDSTLATIGETSLGRDSQVRTKLLDVGNGKAVSAGKSASVPSLEQQRRDLLRVKKELGLETAGTGTSTAVLEPVAFTASTKSKVPAEDAVGSADDAISGTETTLEAKPGTLRFQSTCELRIV